MKAKLYVLLTVLVMQSIISGCAHYGALEKGQSKIDTSKASIILLSVNVLNKYKPNYQPKLFSVNIFRENESEFVLRKNVFFPGDLCTDESNKRNECLLSYQIPPGAIKIGSLFFEYSVPLLLSARATIPINAKLDIKPDSVIYIGRINVSIREKLNKNEELAGLFPLIDSAIVGFSSSSYDVVIEDKYEEDMSIFLNEYPGLKNLKIEKYILPKWIRPEDLPKK